MDDDKTFVLGEDVRALLTAVRDASLWVMVAVTDPGVLVTKGSRAALWLHSAPPPDACRSVASAAETLRLASRGPPPMRVSLMGVGDDDVQCDVLCRSGAEETVADLRRAALTAAGAAGRRWLGASVWHRGQELSDDHVLLSEVGVSGGAKVAVSAAPTLEALSAALGGRRESGLITADPSAPPRLVLWSAGARAGWRMAVYSPSAASAHSRSLAAAASIPIRHMASRRIGHDVAMVGASGGVGDAAAAFTEDELLQLAELIRGDMDPAPSAPPPPPQAPTYSLRYASTRPPPREAPAEVRVPVGAMPDISALRQHAAAVWPCDAEWRLLHKGREWADAASLDAAGVVGGSVVHVV